MIVADAAKAAGLLFLAAIIQISILSDWTVLHGRPQLLLVTVIAVALLRGAVFGALAGFCVGLIADTGVFGMLGFTSLLLTLAGYWTGRYGETTGRERAHAPLLSVAVITVLYQFAALILHFMLGQAAPARLAVDRSRARGAAAWLGAFVCCRAGFSRRILAPQSRTG